MAINSLITHCFHHSQVLEVIVCLKQRISGEELHKYAADTPYVARVGPAQTENNLWCSVVPCRDHRRMIFVLECSGTEVYQPNLCIEENSSLGGLTADCGG